MEVARGAPVVYPYVGLFRSCSNTFSHSGHRLSAIFRYNTMNIASPAQVERVDAYVHQLSYQESAERGS